MKFIFKFLFKLHYFQILFLLFLPGTKCIANHYNGSDLTYKHLGNGLYEIKYMWYTNCSSFIPAMQIDLLLNSVSCDTSLIYTLNRFPGASENFSYTCPAIVFPCTSIETGFGEAWSFYDTIQIPAACNDWIFSVADCCRSDEISTLVDPGQEGFYNHAFLNNSISENSSVSFKIAPAMFLTIGQSNHYNPGAFDEDCDSLVYQFVTPYGAWWDSVEYQPGYSKEQFIQSSPPVTVDVNSGEMSYTPIQHDIGLVAYSVREFRNGIFIGEAMRECVVYCINSSDSFPLLSGIDQTASYSDTFCVGRNSCFSIFSSDADPSDSVSISWDNGIPDGTFSSTSTMRPQAQFCWSPDPSDTTCSHHFTVLVKDNICPSSMYQVYSYAINVQVCIGTDEIQNPNGLSLFPNPASQHCQVVVKDNKQIISLIKIFDLQGRLIQEIAQEHLKSNQCSIPLSALSAGCYLLKCICNKEVYTSQFLKE